MHSTVELCKGLGSGLSEEEHQGDSVLDRDPAPPCPPAPGQRPLQHAHRQPHTRRGLTSRNPSVVLPTTNSQSFYTIIGSQLPNTILNTFDTISVLNVSSVLYVHSSSIPGA